ncbi:MAG: hypothetical protein MUP13_04865, partial [Thermoanaerobaculales bacterium]|nr:hypothetical protein [Thermoanaerobaculales bacterium]
MFVLQTALRVALGLLPVFLFLVALILLDSFKLVRLRLVVLLIVVGAASAAASLVANQALTAAVGIDG